MKVKVYKKNGSILILDNVENAYLRMVKKVFLVDDIDEEVNLNDIKKIVIDDEVIYESED